MTLGNLRAFPTLLRVGFVDALAYRAEFLIWILSTTMPLVMLALWNAVAREQPIGGFGQADFAAYFLGALIVRLLTGMWVVWTLNHELRQGLFAFRLLRPVHPMVHYAAENLAALPVRALFALPVAVVSLLAIGVDKLTHDPVRLATYAASLVGAWLLAFLMMSLIACAAFFVDSSLSVFQAYFGCYMLLSGYLFPISLLPSGLGAVCAWLPFRYMLGFPVETLLGRYGRGEGLLLLGVQWAYIAALLLALSLVWRAGMRRFNAFGG